MSPYESEIVRSESERIRKESGGVRREGCAKLRMTTNDSRELRRAVRGDETEWKPSIVQ